MKALLLSLTLLGTISMGEVKAEENSVNLDMVKIFQEGAKASADQYCYKKDEGFSETRALDEAYYSFTSYVAKELQTTPIIVHESIPREQLDQFWNTFNTFAYENCPEYY